MNCWPPSRRSVPLPRPPPSLIYAGWEYLVSYFAVGGNLFLVGAGHVAACTAEAAARVGFRVIVMDDRIEFANRDRFPLADEIKVLPSFTDCFKGYDIGPGQLSGDCHPRPYA